MDTTDSTHDDLTEGKQSPPIDESLPPFVAYQVEEESRERAPSSSGSAGEHYRHGKVEAETRRVSEEVTREAQRRLRATQMPPNVREDDAPVPSMTPAAPRKTPLPTPRQLRQFMVPLDGTLLGERVLSCTAALARLVGARVLLAHVTPTQPPAMLGRLLHLEASEREESLRTFAPEALPYLRYVQEWRMLLSPQADITHITAPTVAEGLLTLEKSRDIDLVALALGVHGDGDYLGLGNVVDRLIRLGTAPALVLPPEADEGARPFALRHILVALDGSPLAEEALGPLAGLLMQAQASTNERVTVTLLGVAEHATVLPDYQSYLDALRDSLAGQPAWSGVRVDTEVIVGSPPGAIVGAVDRGNRTAHHDETGPVDMLVMTTHGQGGFRRWLLGSVAGYVLPRVHAPVLVVRPSSPATTQH
jgi:nucleotide-binding universal stress UspA family protein